jgi:hypothetical protein
MSQARFVSREKSMLQGFLRLIGVACRHRHTSKPFAPYAAPPRSESWDPVPSTGSSHYVVCFDCGRKLTYDWSVMRIVDR